MHPLLVDAGWELLPLAQLDPERHRGAMSAFGDGLSFESARFEEETAIPPLSHLYELPAIGPVELLQGVDPAGLLCRAARRVGRRGRDVPRLHRPRSPARGEAAGARRGGVVSGTRGCRRSARASAGRAGGRARARTQEHARARASAGSRRRRLGRAVAVTWSEPAWRRWCGRSREDERAASMAASENGWASALPRPSVRAAPPPAAARATASAIHVGLRDGRAPGCVFPASAAWVSTRLCAMLRERATRGREAGDRNGSSATARAAASG